MRCTVPAGGIKKWLYAENVALKASNPVQSLLNITILLLLQLKIIIKHNYHNDIEFQDKLTNSGLFPFPFANFGGGAQVVQYTLSLMWSDYNGGACLQMPLLHTPFTPHSKLHTFIINTTYVHISSLFHHCNVLLLPPNHFQKEALIGANGKDHLYRVATCWTCGHTIRVVFSVVHNSSWYH